VTPTEQFIGALMGLKAGELGLLRTHAGQGIDESVEGFDLFSGLWWPLRQKNERAPRRAVAWLIAKLYASYPIPHAARDALAQTLGQCQPRDEEPRERFRRKFDEILLLPLESIEPALRWAVGIIASNGKPIDWAILTDDLSIWERETIRLRWAGEFLKTYDGGHSC
jgi:CRISPR type I-E-associated protein CasB/Cse2